jgi:hypothetical protein
MLLINKIVFKIDYKVSSTSISILLLQAISLALIV